MRHSLKKTRNLYAHPQSQPESRAHQGPSLLNSPLKDLAGRGYDVQTRTRLPFVRSYRSNTTEAAEQALQSDRSSPVRVVKDEKTFVLQDRVAAETFESIAEDTAGLEELSKLKPRRQTAVLHGLSELPTESRKANLVRMANATVVPGTLQEQMAQLSPRTELLVKDERSLLVNGRVPDREELGDLSQTAEELEIDYDYLQEGCYARSHVLCEILREKGINSSKIFVEGIGLGTEKADPFLVREAGPDSPVRWHPENHTFWRYHTAPIALVESEEGSVEPMVWDPALAKKKKSDSQWFRPGEWMRSFYTVDSGKLDVTLSDEKTYQPGVIQNKLPFDWNTSRAWKSLRHYNVVSQEEKAARLAEQTQAS